MRERRGWNVSELCVGNLGSFTLNNHLSSFHHRGLGKPKPWKSHLWAGHVPRLLEVSPINDQNAQQP